MLTIAVPCIVECVDHIKVHQRAISVYRGASLCPAGTRWQANPMGVTGWGVAGAFTVAGLWTTGYLFSEVVDGRP